jgi:hypothetical protein
MVYLEVSYAQKDEAKLFGARWELRKKRWFFPGEVLPKELEQFRPATEGNPFCFWTLCAHHNVCEI